MRKFAWACRGSGMCGFESSHRDIRAHRDEPETARDVVFSSSYNVAFAPHCAISHRETPSGGKAMHGRAPPPIHSTGFSWKAGRFNESYTSAPVRCTDDGSGLLNPGIARQYCVTAEMKGLCSTNVALHTLTGVRLSTRCARHPLSYPRPAGIAFRALHQQRANAVAGNIDQLV